MSTRQTYNYWALGTRTLHIYCEMLDGCMYWELELQTFTASARFPLWFSKWKWDRPSQKSSNKED